MFKKGITTNPAGRAPKRLTDEQLEEVTKLAARGAHETTLAHHAGVSQTTWTRMKKRDPRVLVALERGRATQHDFLVGTLMKSASQGNVIAALFLLKAKHNYHDQGDAADGRGPHIVINLPGPLTAEEYAKRVGHTIEHKASGKADDDGAK